MGRPVSADSTFLYKVRDADGKFREGKVKASSETAVAEKLRSMGYNPLEVTKAGEGMQKEMHLRKPKVKAKDLAVFTRQLATMINSGLTLIRSLTILAEQSENSELRRALTAVRGLVESGHSLSDAFATEKDAFPPLMINMTRAGEAGGFLDRAMLQIAETFEADVKLRGTVKAAMAYPVVVFCMAILMVIGMLLFIVPIFEKMFADLGGQLPAPTQVLVTISGLMKFIMPVLIVGLIGFSAWWRKHKNDLGVRNVVDPLKLKVPVFGNLFAKIALARFARNFGTLLGSGVPILQAIDIVSETTGSIVISRALDEVKQSVAGGESISGPLSNHEVFPTMVVQMIASGEETGSIDQMLHKIAEAYDQEVEATTEALTSLIEPLMIAGLGAVVGGMIVALYMPIFSVFNLIE